MAEQHADMAVVHAGGDATCSRTADKWLPFLLPPLRHQLTLRDCGGSVSSLTLVLAARVGPVFGPRCARATPCIAQGIA
jgi:hypothetical protein